jgi:hypothetical protein
MPVERETSAGPPPPRRAVRTEPVLVVLLVAVGIGVSVAGAVVAGAAVSPSAPPSGYPIGSAGQVLFYGQAEGVLGYYPGQFVVNATSAPGVPEEVEVAAELNITCGGESSYLLGELNNCSLSLVKGGLGGATEDLLWTESFTGREGSNVSLLAPGTYTVLISVHLGSPPLAVVVVPYSVTLEAAALG